MTLIGTNLSLGLSSTVNVSAHNPQFIMEAFSLLTCRRHVLPRFASGLGLIFINRFRTLMLFLHSSGNTQNFQTQTFRPCKLILFHPCAKTIFRTSLRYHARLRAVPSVQPSQVTSQTSLQAVSDRVQKHMGFNPGFLHLLLSCLQTQCVGTV